MIAVTRTFFWHWKPGVHRLHFGFDLWLPGIKIRVGHDGPPCRVCRKRDGILSWPLDNPGAAICPGCCEHDYERCDGDYACTECGDLAPYDWIDDHCRCDDDVYISFAGTRDPGEPIGTPISQLSGRPGHDGYDKFVQIAKSWGHD
jgi:hypothetical protein